jgi:hypothetical protein
VLAAAARAAAARLTVRLSLDVPYI